MQPTNKLRFVEREIAIHHADCLYASLKTVRVLQQWWEDKTRVLAIYIQDKDGNPLPAPCVGEWRDVPLETEGE